MFIWSSIFSNYLLIYFFIYLFNYLTAPTAIVGKERNGCKDDKENSKEKDKEIDKENRQSRVSRARITSTATLPHSLPLMEDEIVLKNNIALNNSPFKVGQKVLVDSGKNLLWDARVVELRAGKPFKIILTLCLSLPFVFYLSLYVYI